MPVRAGKQVSESEAKAIDQATAGAKAAREAARAAQQSPTVKRSGDREPDPQTTSQPQVLRIEPGKTTVREGKVVTVQEAAKIDQARQMAAIRKRQEATRPAPTKSRIIIDDTTGRQVAAVIQRGKTEADVIRIDPTTGQETTQTIRGIPEFVKQETESITESQFPRTMGEPTPSIAQAQERETLKRLSKQNAQFVLPAQEQEFVGPPSPTLQQRQQAIARRQQEELVKTPKPIETQVRPVAQEPTGFFTSFFTQGPRQFFSEQIQPKIRPIQERLEQQQQFMKENQVVGAAPVAVTAFAPGGSNLFAKGIIRTREGISRFIGGGGGSLSQRVAQSRAQFQAAQKSLGGLRAFTETATGRALVGIGSAEAQQKSIITIGQQIQTKKQKQALTKAGVTEQQLVSAGLISERESVTGFATSPKKLEKASRTFEESVRVFIGAEQDPTISKKFFAGSRGFIRELPTGTLIADDPKAFRKGVRESLQGRGLSRQEINELVKFAERQKRVRGAAEFVGAIGAERAAESVGRRLVGTQFFKRAGQELPEGGFTLGRQIGSRIAVAGVVEGVTGETLQRQARAEQITAKNLAVAGLGGAAIGGTIGGFIAQRTARKGAKDVPGRVVNIFANIIDPLEAPGDIFQNIVERAGTRVRRRTLLQPAVTEIDGRKFFGVGTGRTPRITTPSVSTFIQTQQQQQQQGRRTLTQGERTFDDLIRIGEQETGKVGTPIPPPSPVPIAPNQQITNLINQQNRIVQRQQQQQQEQQEEIQQQVTQFAFGQPTPIPTVVPRPLLPFGAPLVIPTGSGRGRGFAQGTRLFNELNRATNRFFKFVTPPKPKKKRSRKRK